MAQLKGQIATKNVRYSRGVQCKNVRNVFTITPVVFKHKTPTILNFYGVGD